MIVAKFGGTATAPNNVKYLQKCLGKHHGVVVVSAIGREFDGDEKVTDLLGRYWHGDDNAWTRIADKFRRLCLINAVDVDVEELLADAKMRARKFGSDYCLSIGEELTARCIAKLTGLEYVEAQGYVVFDGGKFNLKETLRRLKELGGNRVVMGGFYGGTIDGNRQTFTRGGGDVSGALCAAACNATLYENVTDVDGVFVANPKLVDGAQKLDGLSYDEMLLLAKSGASVLHPDAVEICRKYNVPIAVKSFWKNDFGTLVSNCVGCGDVLGVTCKRSMDGTYAATVLHNLSAKDVALRMWALCDGYDGITHVECDGRVVRMQSEDDVTSKVYRAFVLRN